MDSKQYITYSHIKSFYIFSILNKKSQPICEHKCKSSKDIDEIKFKTKKI